MRGMEDEDEEVLVVTTTCLGVADDGALLNLAGESIQHGVVVSTSMRAVAAATESADTPENTAAEADATAAAASNGSAMERRSSRGSTGEVLGAKPLVVRRRRSRKNLGPPLLEA